MTGDEPSGEIIVYQREDGAPALEVRLEGETVWLSQQQIADLFGTTQQNVSQHLRNIYAEGELDQAATHKDFLLVRREGARDVSRSVAHYNLDAVISVGYRVSSVVATRFRIWATARLREYLIKGFTMDDAKLKNLGGGTYWPSTGRRSSSWHGRRSSGSQVMDWGAFSSQCFLVGIRSASSTFSRSSRAS